MDSNLKHQVDAHQISLDLDGLDELLEGIPELAEAELISETGPDEHAMMLKLLQQVAAINESVDIARERLTTANQRMDTLSKIVQLQTGQLEMLAHYQGQAARVASLECQIANLQEENRKLRQPWYRKIFSGSETQKI